MSVLERKGGSFPDGEEHVLEASVCVPALMSDEAAGVQDTPEQDSLTAHRDARHLVRLVQCPLCSKLFIAPVTLPCGHTVCRACLPRPRTRMNISYPNTPDRQLGIVCPLPTCGAEHAIGECNVDVTMSKVLDVIKTEVSNFKALCENTPTLLEEVPRVAESSSTEKKENLLDQGHQRVLHGGRLLSTLILAELGELDHDADVTYSSMSPTGDDYRGLDTALLNRLREVANKELDCLVCFNMMLDPTTTPCGHTFCRRCLIRAMDHSIVCPVCRRDLHIQPSLQNQPSNERLVALLNTLCPDLVAARAVALDVEEQPGETILNTPLFICTLSFPKMPTFLHIFEPRYRLMMRRCLEGNRQFGMVMYNRSSAPQGDLGATQFMEYGTLLEIVNFELLRDGRSFVECMGVSRFRVREHGMLDGYHVSRIERVEDFSLAEEERLEAEETTAAQAEAIDLQNQDPQAQLTPERALNMISTQDLLTRCMSFIERMRANSAPWLSARIVAVYGGPPNDPALFPYWFAAVLPIAEEEKYLLLKTARVRERLKMVNRWIGRIEGQRWPSGNGCSIL